jgi:hypothetical protein
VLTYVGLAIPLIMIPRFMLLPARRFSGPRAVTTPAQRRAQRITGVGLTVVLGLVAAYATIQARALPTDQSPIERLSLDSLGGEVHVPAGARVVLQGEPQSDQAVSYDEVSDSRHGPATHHHRNFVPITETDWVKGRTVRFVGDLTGQTTLVSAAVFDRIQRFGPAGIDDEPETRETAPGILIASGAPGFLRMIFADRGVVLAPKVWLYTADIDGVRTDWEAVTIIAGIFGAFAFVMGLLPL